MLVQRTAVVPDYYCLSQSVDFTSSIRTRLETAPGA